MRKINDLNKWRDTTCSWIRGLNIVKMVVLLKLVYSFNTIPIKISATIFDKLILGFIWKCKRVKLAKTILKKNKIGGVTFPDFKTCYKTIIIKPG